MTIFAPEIPAVRRLILNLLAANGGSYYGTLQLCSEIPADEAAVLRSLRVAKKRHLVRSVHSHVGCGRGHKTRWLLTEEGLKYVKS